MSTRHLRRLNKRQQLEREINSDSDGELSSGDEPQQQQPQANLFDLLDTDSPDHDDASSSESDHEPVPHKQKQPPRSSLKKKANKKKSTNDLVRESPNDIDTESKDDDLRLIEEFAQKYSASTNKSLAMAAANGSASVLENILEPNMKLLNTAPSAASTLARPVSIFTSNTTYPKMIQLQAYLTLKYDLEITGFTFEMVDKVTYAQVLTASMTHHPETIQLLGQVHAFHPTILYLDVIMALVGQSGNLPMETLEKMLYVYDRVLSLAGTMSSSSSANGSGKKRVRLDYGRMDNRPFFIGLFLRAYALQRQGYFANAVETIKYALQLVGFEPQHDPLGFWLLLDAFSLRIGPELVMHIHKTEELAEYWTAYPNWNFSVALAQFFAASQKKKPEAHDLEKADSLLIGAIKRFGYVVPRLLDRCGIVFTEKERTVFQSRPFLTRSLSEEILADLYVHYTWSFWKQDEVCAWIRRVLRDLVMEDFQRVSPSVDERVLKRHLVLLDLIDNLPIPSVFYAYDYSAPSSLVHQSHAAPSTKVKSWISLIPTANDEAWTPWGVEQSAAWDPYPPQKSTQTSPVAPHEGFYRTFILTANPSIGVSLLLSAHERERSAVSLDEWMVRRGVSATDLPDTLRQIFFTSNNTSSSGSTAGSNGVASTSGGGWTSVLTSLVQSLFPTFTPFQHQLDAASSNVGVAKYLETDEGIRKFMTSVEWYRE